MGIAAQYAPPVAVIPLAAGAGAAAVLTLRPHPPRRPAAAQDSGGVRLCWRAAQMAVWPPGRISRVTWFVIIQ
jgi:hypothetical protein